jgi:hypothetical protein
VAGAQRKKAVRCDSLCDVSRARPVYELRMGPFIFSIRFSLEIFS